MGRLPLTRDTDQAHCLSMCTPPLWFGTQPQDNALLSEGTAGHCSAHTLGLAFWVESFLWTTHSMLHALRPGAISGGFYICSGGSTSLFSLPSAAVWITLLWTFLFESSTTMLFIATGMENNKFYGVALTQWGITAITLFLPCKPPNKREHRMFLFFSEDIKRWLKCS